MRHGETDWSLVNALRLPGVANDLAPLTARGRAEAGAAAEEVQYDLVVSSPMTRALQTAATIAGMGSDLEVNFDLREWLPDSTYSWTSPEEVAAAYLDMRRFVTRSTPPAAKWEPLESVRAQAASPLAPHGRVSGGCIGRLSRGRYLRPHWPRAHRSLRPASVERCLAMFD
jgi:broad specificity phosphatase PhoE